MSHHEKHGKPDKKHKKLLQIFKNRHTQEINMQAATLERSRELDKEREEEIRESGARAARKANKPGNVVWSAKLQEIRNKNTGRTRMATERWNRFAGTEGGGGRGL